MDTAHRAALLYSFATIAYSLAAIASYIWHGAKQDIAGFSVLLAGFADARILSRS